VSQNEFVESIPESIGDLTITLEFLSFRINDLTGNGSPTMHGSHESSDQLGFLSKPIDRGPSWGTWSFDILGYDAGRCHLNVWRQTVCGSNSIISILFLRDAEWIDVEFNGFTGDIDVLCSIPPPIQVSASCDGSVACSCCGC
jgi:hypothetical protein